MNYLKANRNILLFSLAWFLVNLLQSLVTELHEDEAYYWVFSQFPAWGYFDHPPMTAMLIKLGYALFHNELGVRLFHCLLGSGTIFLVYKLIPQQSRQIRIYILLIPAISLMHINVAGFMALPDIPLIFFTCIYLLLLKRYLVKDEILTASGLALVIALMMYSKYHALLIFFFTLLAERRLMLRRSFWMIVGLSVLIYLPHILWQVHNDFVSFEYHLVGRSTSFRVKHLFTYLGNQILVTGPLTGFLLLYLSFTRRTGDAFERILKFNLYGFFGFFLLSSIRGHVEPHWTAAAFPPMIILAIQQLNGRLKLKKWLVSLAVATFPIVIILRLYLMIDFLPMPGHVSRMFHRKDTWIGQIEEVAGDRPVVFRNKYQYPSLYRFYAQKPAFTRNSMYYRRNQYDVWDMEHELNGKEVLLNGYGGQEGIDTMETVYGPFYFYELDRYCSYNILRIKILNRRPSAPAGDTLSILLRITNPREYPVCLDCPCDMPPFLVAVFSDGRGNHYFSRMLEDPDLSVLQPGEVLEIPVRIQIPAPAGHYRMRISFRSRYLNPGINGKPVDFKVLSSHGPD